MELISVNLGQERILQRNDYVEHTGIFKSPAMDPVKITKLGLENDVVYDKKNHGGVDQAVYVYGGGDYEWWSKELEKEFLPGTFGENLTISELKSAEFNVGDYIQIGEVTLQVTAPRIPCAKFAARMEDPQWVKRFRDAERPGFYCRVIEEGFVRAGDAVSVEKYTGETISIARMYRDYYDKNKSEEVLRLHLNAPIAVRLRRRLEADLGKLLLDRLPKP